MVVGSDANVLCGVFESYVGSEGLVRETMVKHLIEGYLSEGEFAGFVGFATGGYGEGLGC